MLALGLLNPLLLWALPLVAVPIIIHLLNRRRFQKIPWAAMEYLLTAMKRNRRRLRMEHWILLALRTLAVLLLVFLVTRPQLAGGGLIGVRTHHVVCLDDTASMAQRGGAVSVYDSAEEKVQQLVRSLIESSAGDLFSLLRASRPQTPVLSAARIGPQLAARVAEVLNELQVSDQTMDLGVLLQEARRRAAETEETGETDLYLITDFRQRDWLTEDGAGRSEVAVQIMEMHPDQEHLTVFSLAPDDNDNLTVVEVLRKDRLSVAGVPVTLGFVVKNMGLSESAPTELAVEVDGRSRVVRPVEQSLQPGESVEIQIDHTFHEPGFHGVSASLLVDRYPVDDVRTLALEVQDRSRVLLVDGDPKDRPQEAETFFLATSLDPGGDSNSGIEVRVVSELGLNEQQFDGFSMIWLCNITPPEPDVVERLEQFAAEGGGIVFFLGYQVADNPIRFNEAFYRDGEGLLPMPLGEVSGDPDRPDAIFFADDTHPAVARASNLLRQMFGQRMVLLKRHISVLETPGAGASVILRVGDDQGTPLMVSRSFRNAGEVMLIATSADAHWTNWPVTYAYLIITNEIHRSMAKVHDLSSFNLTPGETHHVELDLGRYRPDLLVRSLQESGDERTFTALSAEDATGTVTVDVPMAELASLGLFEVTLEAHGGRTEQRLFARNPPVEEGLLEKFTDAGFVANFPADAAARVTILESDGTSAADLGGRGELWRILGLAMLVSLLLESLLAWRFGRR